MSPELFFESVAHHAAATPDAIAVEGPSRVVTYRELNDRSAALARQFRSRGLGPDDVVGVLLADSADVVMALVAIARAGAAFFILDRASAPERLREACSRARLAMLVADMPTEGIVEPARRFDYSLESRDDDSGAREWPHPEPGNLAYVILTSGSVGVPKLVAVEHRSIAFVLRAQRRTLGLSARARILQSSSLSFDGFIFEVLMALGAGGTLVCRPPGMIPAGRELTELLISRRITHLLGVPSMLMMTPSREGHCLQVVMAVGEACPPQLFERWPGVRLFNLYGPAEATMWTTFHEISAPPAARVPIGHPIDGAACLILDEQVREVADGEVGILYVGDELAARGYLGDPGTTADRFVPNPYRSSGRLYKTNDLVRRNPDGLLEYLGRADAQLKIRGFRIDPFEIQACLLACPGILGAELIVDDERLGRQRLIAFCVTAPEVRTDDDFEASVIECVSRKLAPHSVPSRVLTIPEFPLSRAGKVDHKALALLMKAEQVIPFRPADALEHAVYEAWKEVLGLSAIEVDANFFRIGGNSLLAIQASTCIGERLDIRMNPTELFRHPSLQQFVERVRERAGADRPSRTGSPDWAPASATHFPLSLQQEAIWGFQQLFPRSAAYTVVDMHRVTGRFGVDQIRAVIGEIAARHPMLTARLVPGGEPQFELARPDHGARLAAQAVEVIDPPGDGIEARLAGAIQALSACSAAVIALDGLTALFRCKVFRLADGDVVVGFVAHHLIWDAWCSQILMPEICRALSVSQAAPAVPVLRHGGHYASWQRRQLATGALAQEGAFWQSYLGGARPVSLLPEAAPGESTNARRREFEFGDVTEQDARRLAAQCGTSLFVVLITAFACALHRWSGAEDLLVLVPISNRLLAGLDKTVGFLVSSVPFRFRFEAQVTGRALIEAADAHFHDVQTRLDLPFAAALKPVAGGAPAPAVDAVFSFTDSGAPSHGSGEIHWAPLPMSIRQAKLPLVLAMHDHHDSIGGFALANEHLIDSAAFNEICGALSPAVAALRDGLDLPIFAAPDTGPSFDF